MAHIFNGQGKITSRPLTFSWRIDSVNHLVADARHVGSVILIDHLDGAPHAWKAGFLGEDVCFSHCLGHGSGDEVACCLQEASLELGLEPMTMTARAMQAEMYGFTLSIAP